ncbi:hypothetical protein F5B21DRAFT_321330 [Xylaria acuta]|nr:hypothetical protein F5B21DRAFT_321330 [Xylaria acuta]
MVDGKYISSHLRANGGTSSVLQRESRTKRFRAHTWLSYSDGCSSLKTFVPLLGSEVTSTLDPETTSDAELRAINEVGV